MEIRINKFLSQYGFCSRRKADKLIDDGRVTVNNTTIQHGYKVKENDTVKVDGEKIKSGLKKNIYIAFNKPKGIVCTTDTEKEENNIIDFINFKKRIFPIGRLDKLSEGLILLTNDGDIVNKILRSRYNHEKEYIVTVNKPITTDFIFKMSQGIPILNTITRKCFVKQIHKKQFRIVLTQGLNRQIRRMCEHLNYRVIKLKRIRIMNITLDIDPGKYRELTESEINSIKELVLDSNKTFD